MRGLLLAGLVALAGCGAGSPADPPKADAKAEPKKDAAPAFDAKDAMKTLKWLVHEIDRVEPPAGNAVAAKAAGKEHRKALDKAAGEKVEWVVEAGGVSPDGRVGVQYVIVVIPDVGPRIMHVTPVRGRGVLNSLFPVGDKPWVAKVKKGDRLILAGKLKRIVGDWEGREFGPDYPDRKGIQWWAEFEDFTLEPAP